MTSKQNALEEAVADAVARANKPKSEAERREIAIKQALADLGGLTVNDDTLVFQGTKFILPKEMEGDVDEAIDFLTDWRDQQETTFSFTKTFNYRPWDGAAAFERAMVSKFGTTGLGRGTGFFGMNPPQYISIPTGPDGASMQVPWGRVQFSPLKAEFYLDSTRSREYGQIFSLHVEAPKKYRRHVEGFFKVVEEELQLRSIYKAKSFYSSSSEPVFLNPYVVDPRGVVYTQEVMTQLDVNLWAPLRYSQALRDNHIPLKRAVLVEGPNGTGKTLAGTLTAQIANAHDWTYILVRRGEDALDALKLARMYAPAVVWYEDLDTLADVSQDRDRLAEVLDALDGVQAKGTEVMAGFTTNFAERLDKSVVRAGRLDAVIHVAELDAESYERLIKVTVAKDLLADNVDFAEVVQSYEGFLPAFATEAIQRAVRYSIARNQGVPTQITTEDLVDAAKGMQAHLKLMDEAGNAEHERVTVDARLAELVSGQVAEALKAIRGELVAPKGSAVYDITFKEDDGKE